MNDLQIYEEIVALARQGVASALATVVESVGSSPRKAGAKMLVRSDGSILGTIGGGKVELETIAAALAAMQSGLPSAVPFTLTEEYGHVCGGRLLVYIEPAGLAPDLLVVGAGHVGRSLSSAAKFAGFRVTVTDDRPDFATREQLPAADEVHLGESAELLGRLKVTAGTCIVITTTGFEKDFAAVRAALRTSARYIGLIGSARKREVLLRTLAEEGFPPEEVRRISIPVGLAIGAETPAEIAISVVAQLIQQRRRNHAAASFGDRTGSGTVAPDGGVQTAADAG